MKQLLGNDICRCVGRGCPSREECLRHTDVHEGQRYPFSNLYDKDGDKCDYKITLAMWEKG